MTELEDIEDGVRRGDPDRWLASRFVGDRQARADMLALCAFDHVLARVPSMVSEPLMGEIRFAWWREAVDEIYGGGSVRSHPVALALAEAVRRRRPDRASLDDLIDARIGDLDALPFADEAELLAYADQTGGAFAQLAAQMLGAAEAQGARLAGRAYALSELAHRRAIGGKTRLPESVLGPRLQALVNETLAEAARGIKDLPVPAFPAVSYACLARRYARGAHLTLLEKQLRLVWAAAMGAL